MLIMGETPNQRKAYIVSSIKQNRDIIARFTKHNTEGQFSESMTILRQEIRDYMKELLDLERWRRKEGYDPNQPYEPRSTTNKMKGQTNG